MSLINDLGPYSEKKKKKKKKKIKLTCKNNFGQKD